MPKEQRATLKVAGASVTVIFGEDSEECELRGPALQQAARWAIIDLISTYGEAQNPAALVRFEVH